MSEPIWIEEQETLLFHERLLVQHGGASGVRDKGLLASALARPKQHATYAKAPDLPYLAALYTAGIVKNHPFVDGNKRTGFIVGALFLELNGYRLTASQEMAAHAVIMLAAGEMDERGYADFLVSNMGMAQI
jgi:death-on-curing protein